MLRAGWFDEGRCAVQDEAAGLVVRLLDPQPGETIRDVCAAPGGKSLYAAMRMQDQGRVLSTDANRARTGLVRESAAAHGLSIVEAATADARASSAPPTAFCSTRRAPGPACSPSAPTSAGSAPKPTSPS